MLPAVGFVLIVICGVQQTIAHRAHDTSRDFCANETDIIDHLLYDTTVNYNRHKPPSDPVVVNIEL